MASDSSYYRHKRRCFDEFLLELETQNSDEDCKIIPAYSFQSSSSWVQYPLPNADDSLHQTQQLPFDLKYYLISTDVKEAQYEVFCDYKLT